jgi:hypothetical protein
MNKPFVIPIIFFKEFPKEDQKEFLDALRAIKRRYPEGVGLIVAEFENGNPIAYWNEGQFLARFGDEARAESPRLYGTFRGAAIRAKLLANAFPGKIFALAYWIHPDIFPETSPIERYMKITWQFPGTVQQ